MGIFNNFIGTIHRANKISSPQSQSLTSLNEKDAPSFAGLVHEPFGGPGKAEDGNLDYQKLYGLNAPIYRAVSVIANNISMLPVRIMDGESDVTDSGDYQLFKAYNANQTHFDFWEQTIGFLELTGECFWLLDRDNAGKVISAVPVRPDLIEVVPSNQFVVDHYLFNKSGKSVRIEAEEMFFLKYYNPTNHIRGLSPISAAQSDIVLELNAVTSSKSLFERGAQPSGIISTEMDMSQGDWDRTRGYISREHSGTNSAGKIMFLTHGLKWQQMQMNQKDMQYMEQRQWTKDTVSEVYGIPPVFLMQFKEASVIANADVQYRLLWDTLKPKIKRIEQIISEKFIPMITDRQVNIEFDLGNISALQPDIEKLADRYRVGFNMGAVSPNDYREDVLGMDRVEDEMMDGHFVGSTMLPIGDIGMNFDEPEKSINGKLNKIDKAIDSLEGNTELQTITKELQAESYSQKESELTAEAKQIHRGLLRIQRSVSKRFEADTKKLFKKQMADIVSKFGQKSFYKASAMNVSDVFDFEMWVMQFEELGDEYLTEALMRAGEEFANSIDDVFILSDPRIEDYIGTRAKEYATIVNNTTKEKIDKLLKQGASQDLSMAQLGSSIESYFKSQSAFRAARIARTEVVGATNFGRFHAMKQTGRVKNHMWSSQRDALVRDTHAGLDGAVVKVGDAFSVPPGYLGNSTYPSDINERCFTLPVKVEKTAGDKRVDALLGDEKLPKEDIGAGLANKVTDRTVPKTGADINRKFRNIGKAWREVLGDAQTGKRGSKFYLQNRKAFYELLEKKKLRAMHEWLTEQWQSMSNGRGAGIIKRYISKRFGVQTQFHSKYLDENAKLTAEFNRLVAGFMRDKGMTFSKLDEYFDLMRQFNANLIERFGFLNKDGTITLYRGIHGSYFRDAGLSVPKVGDSGVMAANSAESWSTSITAAKGFTGTDGVIIRATFKADDILFSPFGWDDIRYASESEFVIGGMKEVSYKAVWQK